jgi:GH15 family glucan-1,4-alpha-glucosidase
MPDRRIEDYALIGDCRTAALVSRDGSIDWLCLPRFDSPSCFTALLGTHEHGRWQIAPSCVVSRVERRYRPGTLVLETEFTTERGAIKLIDAMAMTTEAPTVLRLVEGVRGEVPVGFELAIRFDYGSVVPWVRRRDGGITAIAGPDSLRIRSDVELRGENMTTVSEFVIREGERVAFDLAWHRSHLAPPPPVDVRAELERAERWWRDWSGRYQGQSRDRDAVLRSLITLKALTFAPTGGIAAAPTTSLPERIGGVRNWDYRHCWLRDATFTLYSLMIAGFHEEARAWREWLLRAVAGTPSKLQIMYGLAGERRLSEWEVDWLPGFENSRPVRVGNAASGQFQLDVYGEVLDVLYQGRKAGLSAFDDAKRFALGVLKFLEMAWEHPDEGIWEVRGERRDFTHSKVMAWVAFDRAVKAVEQLGLEGPVDRWKSIRDAIHVQVCREGFNPSLNSFVQSYGSNRLDASLLMIPLVGFLPADDPRMRGTVEAISRDLDRDGFIARYNSDASVDGLPPGEGAFLPCTFWLADNLALQGRYHEARELFDKLLAIRNDVGLLAEEYDPRAGRQLGNFPQAFSHVSLINTAHNLEHPTGPALDRGT